MKQVNHPGLRHGIVLTIWLFLATQLAASVVDRGTRPDSNQARHSPLRGESGLVRAYDFILEARFDQVDAELRRACDPGVHPDGALVNGGAAPAEAIFHSRCDPPLSPAT